MGYDYPFPDNEIGFEQLCLHLYREIWGNEYLQLYAKRGEKQDGVDIYDPLCSKPVRVVQCKHRELSKNILPSEIKSEVNKAEQSVLNIDLYFIATTAKKSKNAQDTVVELNQRSDKKFDVIIQFREDLNDELSQLPRIKAELIVYGENILAESTAQRSTTSVISGSLHVESEEDNEPYLAIEGLLEKREVELAQYELEKFLDSSFPKPRSPESQYKLLRLRARIELEKCEYETAADLFLQAHEVSPSSAKAKQNQVLAYYLLNQKEKAYNLAKQYIEEGLSTPVMILRLIQNATTLEQLEENSSAIAPYLDSDEDVNTALAHFYLELEDYDKSSIAAQRALELSPDSPHAHLAVALAIHNQSVYGEVGQQVSGLQKSLEHYDSAETNAREQRYNSLLPELLFNRAVVKMQLRNISGAEIDFRSAIEAAPHPARYAERAIRFFLQEEDYEKASSLLGFLDTTVEEGQYIKCLVEYHFADSSEKNNFIVRMEKLAKQYWRRTVECHVYCVQWALESKDFNLAKKFITESFLEKHPFQAHTLLSWIHLVAKNNDKAEAETRKALKESVQSAKPFELRILAQVLLRISDFHNALILLEQVARPGRLDEDMKDLFDCAQQLDRHDIQLRICRELRATGAQDEKLRRIEIDLLRVYAPIEAFRLVDEFIRCSDNPNYFNAYKNLLAVHLKKSDELNLDSSLLPEPSELPPYRAELIVLPYEFARKYKELLAFLYAQRKQFYEQEVTHGRYMCYFLKYANMTELLEPPDKVSCGSAVLLELYRGEHRWVILEDDSPIVSRNEFSSNSELGKVLLGKEVGEVIELPGNLVQVEKATIQELQTKYLRAFQESFSSFRRLFPESSRLQEIKVGEGDNFDPSPIVENLKNDRDIVKECFSFYEEHPISLYLFAARVGLSEFEAVKTLAHHPKALIRCCHGTPQELDEGVNKYVSSDKVVLTISAIITLTLIDGWKFLDPQKQHLISHLTNLLIDEWIQNAEEGMRQEQGWLSLDENDQLILEETAAEAHQSRISELEYIREMVDHHCEIHSSISVAQIEPEKREKDTELVGSHTLESLSVAKDHGAVVWSDDQVTSYLSIEHFGVPIVRTQIALKIGVETDSVSPVDFIISTAKLVALSYSNVEWNASTIIAAGIAANWNPESWPYPQCLRAIAKLDMNGVDKKQITIEFLKLLRRSNCFVLKQSAVIQSFLNEIGDNETVRDILRYIDLIFGIDVQSATFIKYELSYWLKLR